MNRLRAPSASQCTRLIAQLKQAPLTYPEVGATQTELPDGYDHLHHRVRLGQGGITFRRAAATVQGWELHRRAGLEVAASAPRADRDVVVVVGMRVGPVWVLAPCRVVWVVDQPRRCGFGYGTLPGHPECGEEAFMVELDDAGMVWLAVTAFSRPASWSARLLARLARRQQRRVSAAYLRAFDHSQPQRRPA